MKGSLAFLLFQLLLANAYAQKSFEGEIVYSASVTSYDSTISNERLSQFTGTVMHHFIKGGCYLSTFNGIHQWQLYRDKDKKLYDKYTTRDSVLWRDVSINHDTIFKTSLKKSDTTILGYSCVKLIFICNNGTQVYYFNSQFAIDPNLYADANEGNWYEFLKISKAPALKEVIHRGKITYTLTATSIERKSLSDQLFDLPTDKGIIKNPFVK